MALDVGHLSRGTLRDLAVQVLLSANTLAQDRVYDPNTLPQQILDLPTMVVSAQSSRKETTGDGNPKFNTDILLAVMVRVAGSVTDQKGVQLALDTLVDQVEQAILCTPAMVAPVQRFKSVDTHTVLDNSTDTLVGEGTIVFACEVPQDYLPDTGAPLTGFTATTAIPPGQGPVFQSFLQPSP